eukprot:scaffold48844_cov36-Prasinocladus_malaysianus.AAC.2
MSRQHIKSHSCFELKLIAKLLCCQCAQPGGGGRHLLDVVQVGEMAPGPTLRLTHGEADHFVSSQNTMLLQSVSRLRRLNASMSVSWPQIKPQEKQQWWGRFWSKAEIGPRHINIR